MVQQKQSLQQTLQIIADILSFETSSEVLKHQLKSDEMDWDSIVMVASSHLVLPAVYCRLEQASLLEYLPTDLNDYLKELTELNRVRNYTLFQEVKEISKRFNETHIDHVFIKGTALLAGNYYKDFGERMIGDIDILVASDHLDKAFKLLVAEGYSQFVEFNYEVKNYRHRPRQISQDRIGAIELHDQLLKHGYNHLIDKDVFLSTKEIVNGIAIPTSENLIWNTILAQQINDNNAYLGLLNLRGLYDILVLRLNHNKEMLTRLHKQKFSRGFLSVSSVFIPSLYPTEQSFFLIYRKQFFQLLLKYRILGGIIIKMKLAYLFVKERIKLLIINKSYRTHVFKGKRVK